MDVIIENKIYDFPVFEMIFRNINLDRSSTERWFVLVSKDILPASAGTHTFLSGHYENGSYSGLLSLLFIPSFTCFLFPAFPKMK